MGTSISLDDFGIGFSSLSYLKNFKIDSLKIDYSFIQGIGRRKSDEAIIKTIIYLVESLELNVVAEGVETEEQYEFLKEQGCN